MNLPPDLAIQAECISWPVSIFYVEPNDQPGRDRALTICNACTVRNECLDHNLEEAHGIIGGTTERDRRRIRSARYQARRAAA